MVGTDRWAVRSIRRARRSRPYSYRIIRYCAWFDTQGDNSRADPSAVEVFFERLPKVLGNSHAQGTLGTVMAWLADFSLTHMFKYRRLADEDAAFSGRDPSRQHEYSRCRGMDT